jgi:hypothetical protein
MQTRPAPDEYSKKSSALTDAALSPMDSSDQNHCDDGNLDSMVLINTVSTVLPSDSSNIENRESDTSLTIGITKELSDEVDHNL